MFGENPVCSLCNYHTYALFHLDNIQQLDGVDITVEARQAAEATFVKKKMFVEMASLCVNVITSQTLNLNNQFHFMHSHPGITICVSRH